MVPQSLELSVLVCLANELPIPKNNAETCRSPRTLNVAMASKTSQSWAAVKNEICSRQTRAAPSMSSCLEYSNAWSTSGSTDAEKSWDSDKRELDRQAAVAFDCCSISNRTNSNFLNTRSLRNARIACDWSISIMLSASRKLRSAPATAISPMLYLASLKRHDDPAWCSLCANELVLFNSFWHAEPIERLTVCT